MVKTSMRDIWQEGGALAGVIEGYEHRPQQEEFASCVEDILDEGGLLVAEAPTGVGKSLAYLVPSIDWALTNGERVVVSTNTRNLQDQLYNKDIPKVAALFKRRIDAAVVKGRSNYACLRRWNLLSAGQIELSAGGIPESAVSALAKWIDSTEIGDLAEIGEGRAAADAVRVEDGLCDPARCSVGDDCFLRRLRRRASNAQVLCVNHAILLGQLLGCWDVLPPFDVLVIDEGHNIDRVAADRLGVSLRAGALNRSSARLLGMASSVRGGSGGAKRVAAAGPKLAESLRRAGRNVEGLFGGLREMLGSSPGGRTMRYREDGEPGRTVLELGGPLLESCIDVDRRLRDAIAAGPASAEMLEQMEAELALWMEMTRDLERLLSPVDGDGVFWIDSVPSLRWAPTDVSDVLGPAVDGPWRATVITSATLAVNGNFDYFNSTIGTTRENSCYPRCVSLKSPFDIEGAVRFLVPGDAPDPRDGSYTGYVAGAVGRLLESSRRKALVLFTSHSMLRAVRAKLDGGLEKNIFAQGVDGDRAEITRAFKSAGSGALLGTASFWEGVDFPGEEAELLVIARLPFPVPSDPVVEARSEALLAKGVEPFTKYHLPEAVMRLRQGFGRLIRTAADRGVAVVLDPRLARASYKGAFVGSLPVAPSVMESMDAVAEAAAEWFQGVKENA
jgi:Rad3-related DNA helicase